MDSSTIGGMTMNADDDDRKKIETLPDWFGSRSGGGRGCPPRTAIGMSPDGDSASGGAVRTRLAIDHSDADFVFALKVLLSPLIDSGQIELTSSAKFNLLTRKFEGKVPLQVDIVVTDLTCSFAGLDEGCVDKLRVEEVVERRFNAKEQVPFADRFKYSHRKTIVVAYTSTALAAKYFFRMRRANIGVCLWRFGLSEVIDAICYFVSSGRTPSSQKVLEHFRMPAVPAPWNQNLELAHFQMLNRMMFANEILSKELGLSVAQVTALKSQILFNLQKQTVEDAVAMLSGMGIQQMSLETDVAELREYVLGNLSAISCWLTNALSGSNV